MATRSMAEGNVPRSFGEFYPTGHVVIFFACQQRRCSSREAPRTGGYEDGEIAILSSAYVASAIEDALLNVSLLAQLGSETRHVQEHLELAKQGCDKMIVYAPTEHESKRVMNVARRFDIRLAESTTGW